MDLTERKIDMAPDEALCFQFDIFDMDDQEFSDLLERIILARENYKKVTGKSPNKQLEVAVAGFEGFVRRELNI